VDEDRAAPVVVADLAHERLLAGLRADLRRRLVGHVDRHPLDLGAVPDALQDVWVGDHRDVLATRDADHDTDGEGAGFFPSAGDAPGAQLVAEFRRHLLHQAARLRADRGMIGQAARDRGAGEIQALRDELLIDLRHGAGVTPESNHHSETLCNKINN
jgi:hypothetical protein